MAFDLAVAEHLRRHGDADGVGTARGQLVAGLKTPVEFEKGVFIVMGDRDAVEVA